MSRVVHAGIGETVVMQGVGQISAIGLGSCVAVAMYDPSQRIGGMVHVLLPESRGQKTELPGKFADTGVPYLLDLMLEKGAFVNRLVVKIAGGASLMSVNVGSFGDIGKRNVEAVRTALSNLGLMVTAEDVGGHEGRTFTLDVGTGVFTVKTVRGGLRQI
ncbi:chemotaxis protein CheD [Coprothermobacteraceae bacterium]|nr:chemotaxis protein CheD [Coprothermobacteraceae bacterium]